MSDEAKIGKPSTKHPHSAWIPCVFCGGEFRLEFSGNVEGFATLVCDGGTCAAQVRIPFQVIKAPKQAVIEDRRDLVTAFYGTQERDKQLRKDTSDKS